MNKLKNITLGMLLCTSAMMAQKAKPYSKSLADDSNSKYAKVWNTDMDAVKWTNGFWADRFNISKDTMIFDMWRVLKDPKISHAYRNFEIAAGVQQGEHFGPPFFDGDFYKWFESVAAVYSITHDPKLDKLMDEIIAVVSKCQREDGYIHTPVIIKERKEKKKTEFENRLNFETYNLGHLMTAGCVHYRATGKKTLLNMSIKATDYLYNFYKRSSPELARNAICPSHYMGVVEMYRTTKDPRYLELAENLINIRGLVEKGTDDNQDRIPFRKQMKAMGHAVRANYLYAGVADIYSETGEDSLMTCLKSIWNDVTNRKMYITGACGALYDGTSPDGTSYEPDSVQKVHQSYGRAFQLPNHTAHNESCANIGNMLWNWRMFQLTGDAKYTDIVETVLYNSLLASLSLDQKRYFYTNPLSVSADFPYKMRWSKTREDFISCYCCPPNIARTMAEVQDYVYSVSAKGVYVNLYGGSALSSELKDGSKVKLSQSTDYPWNEKVTINVDLAPKKAFSIFLRIPGWCNKATLLVNGKAADVKLVSGQYAELNNSWKKGDKLELTLDMPAKLMASNPLVEETRNQVSVKRGPVVYCLESKDIPAGTKLADIAVPASIKLTPKEVTIDNSRMMSLEGQAICTPSGDWSNSLYKEIPADVKKVSVSFVPYYAWGNRGKADMEVWVPLAR